MNNKEKCCDHCNNFTPSHSESPCLNKKCPCHSQPVNQSDKIDGCTCDSCSSPTQQEVLKKCNCGRPRFPELKHTNKENEVCRFLSPEEAKEKCEHKNWQENGCRLGCFSSPDWEKEFDEQFEEVILDQKVRTVVKGIKSFIRSAIATTMAEEYERGCKDGLREDLKSIYENAVAQERSRILAIVENMIKKELFDNALLDYLKVAITSDKE